jgi:preprotein translocase YajC subunit
MKIPYWVWSVVIIVVVTAVYMYLLNKRYQKNYKMISDLQNSLKAGDPVVLSSGIHGTVKSLEGKTAVITVAQNTDLVVDRLSIASIVQEKKENTGTKNG